MPAALAVQCPHGSNWHIISKDQFRGGSELIDRQQAVVSPGSSQLAFIRGVDINIAHEYMMVMSSVWVDTAGDGIAIQTKDGGATWVYAGSWKGHVLYAVGHAAAPAGSPNNGADYAYVVEPAGTNAASDSGVSGVIFINISNRVHGTAQMVSRNNSSSFFVSWAGFETITHSVPSQLCNGFRLFNPAGTLMRDATVGAGEVWLYRLRK
jgi:hypothetical protein